MKHPKLNIGDRIDMLLITGRRKAGQGQKIVVYWTVQCDCGRVREMRTNHIRMPRATVKVSCGCLRKKTAVQQLAIARARIGMQERDERDPTPLEIAERCLDIHNEADRQAPVGLVGNLKRLRQANVRTDSPGASRRPTMALLEVGRRHEDSDSG